MTDISISSARLTFDDGPGPSTPMLLDVLKAATRPSTFFVLGNNLAAAMDVAIRMVTEGHVLGNHAYSHARPDALSEQALIEEIAATDALIRSAYESAGRQPPGSIPLRLPYGMEADDPRQRVLDRLGRTHTGWTLIVDDWCRPPPSPQELADTMRQHIAAQTKRGDEALICLHDSSRHREAHPATVEAVRMLLGLPDSVVCQ